MNYAYVVMALAGGLGLSIQAAINTRLGLSMGGQSLVAALTSFTVGAVCLLIIALWQADWHSVAGNVGKQPWWNWTGGLIGAAFVFTSIFLSPRLGVSNTMFLFIIGQLTAGMLIDGFGLLQMPLRPLHWWKFAGMAIMLGGVAVFMFGDRWFE